MREAREPIPPAEAALLADFARAFRAAARVVTLYPPTHPAISQGGARLAAAASRLAAGTTLTLTVHPSTLDIGSGTVLRPDVGIGELAAWLHERLIGVLRVPPTTGRDDWTHLLLALGRSPEDLRRDGGAARAVANAGHTQFEILEIDYAEVLRERAGGAEAEWPRIIAHCLQDDVPALDERAIAALIATFAQPAKLLAFIDALETASTAQGLSAGLRAAGMLQLLRRALEAIGSGMAGLDAADGERILQSMSDVAPRLSAELMLALLDEARAAGGEHREAIDDIVDRMGMDGIAEFVANAVATDQGASECLTQAFHALVPERGERAGVVDVARSKAVEGLGGDSGVEELWEAAAAALMSDSEPPVPLTDHGREPWSARALAVDVERTSDDPPSRIQAWMATVSEAALRELDVTLLRDLLRLEGDASAWQTLAALTVGEIERRSLLGEMWEAQRLTDALARELGPDGRPALTEAAHVALDSLAAGPLVRNIVIHLRRSEGRDPTAVNELAHAAGPRLAEPLAEALAVEEHRGTVRRLRELLLAFGAAGRQSVERLKNSPNPAVRRMAIDLLRVFGGREALPELASMLDDADPQVQRESIRAIVQIETADAYAVLEAALTPGRPTRDTVLQELIALRDDKAIPLLCHVLARFPVRGRDANEHAQIIDALGGLGDHPASTRTLRDALHRGQWWAPYRTAALRAAAAAALRRIGSPAALACLEEAATCGSRGVRTAARAQIAGAIEHSDTPS